MTIAIWNDSYLTGNQAVDNQHQELFKMVNDLHHAIVSGHGKELTGPTLDRLVSYTVSHFKSEEELMRLVNYPAYGQHRTKHLALTDEVSEFVSKYRRGEFVLSTTVSSFLANWLAHHIKQDDIRYFQEHAPAAKP
jgi:hemerythrin